MRCLLVKTLAVSRGGQFLNSPRSTSALSINLEPGLEVQVSLIVTVRRSGGWS